VTVTQALPSRVVFDRRRWLALSLAQQRALLRVVVDYLIPEPEEIAFAPLEAAVHFSRDAQPGRSCELAGDLVLWVEAAQIVVAGAAAAPERRDRPHIVDGKLAPGWRLVIEAVDTGAWSLAQIDAAARWTTYVDAERLDQPLTLRARHAGDHFQPLGFGGHTAQLSDFLINLKVPAEQRDGWPLLMCGEAIVWVVGLRLDERFRVRNDTLRVTRVSLVPAAEA
jgi:tRNA(Ile)-lysidine synthetase-like protein